MTQRDTAVVDIDRTRITVTLASFDGGRAVVKSCRSFVRPAEVDMFDGAAVGAWVREKLRDSGTLGARVVLALPRGEVIIKRLVLPVGESTAMEDVVGAVKLQMSRQLSVPAEASAIDYVPAPQTPPSAEGAQGGMTVTAVALPGDRMDWARGMARAGGMKLARIGLRCFGAGCVLSEESLRRDGAVLGVVPSASSVEFVVVEGGHVMLARAVDIPWPSEDTSELETYADKVAVEAKRTWMSHRAGGGTLDCQVVIALGAGVGAEKLAERCGASLERQGITLLPQGGAPARQEQEPAASVAASALGLLMEEASGREALDLLHPRRAPDRAARRRQIVLGGTLVAIVGIGTPLVMAQMQISSLDDVLKRQHEVTAARQTELNEMWAEHARLRNLEEWSSIKVDWVSHIGALSAQIPAPPEALIEGLNGTVSAQVDFTAKGGQYAGGTWSTAQTSSFTISGRVKQRETAASLRGRFAAGEVYSVESPAPDTGDRFSFELFTPFSKPEKPPQKQDAKQSDSGSKPKQVKEKAKLPATSKASQEAKAAEEKKPETPAAPGGGGQ